MKLSSKTKNRMRPCKSKLGSRRLFLESLENRRVLNVDWMNPADSLDADADKSITPLDVLAIVNDLNRFGSRRLPQERPSSSDYLDVDGDQSVTPLDVLQLVNYINSYGTGQRTLQDKSQLVSHQEILIGLGSEKGSRHYRMEIDADLGESPAGSALMDTFSVYVVHSERPNETILDRGVEGTSVFSISPGKIEMATGVVRWDGKILEIDMSSLNEFEKGRLRVELLNVNQKHNSTVSIRPLENVVDPEGDVYERASNPNRVHSPGPVLDLRNHAPIVDANVSLSNLRFDATSDELILEMSVKNGTKPLAANLAVVIPNLPNGVRVINASGIDSKALPYVNFRDAISGNLLGANQQSENVEIRISNPGKVPFDLVTEVIAVENAPPVIEPIPDQQIIPGRKLQLKIPASDANADRLVFSVLGEPTLPTTTVDAASGLVTFAPTPAELGVYSVVAMASDGELTVRRRFNLSVVPDTISTTRVSGKVLDVDETPIVGLPVEIGGVRSVTRSDGSFVLDLGTGVVAADTIKIRGELYQDPQRPTVAYPFIAEKLPFMFGRELFRGFENSLDRPIFLPKLNAGTSINPSLTTVVQSVVRQNAEPVKVSVAAGTLFTQSGAPFAGQLSITEVPVDRTPAALPPNFSPSLLVTIQPGEMVFSTPAPLSFPNTAGWAPQSLMDLWSINPVTGEFEIVGAMRVSADGKSIDTISGGIRNSSWHAPAPPPPSNEPSGDNKRNKDDDCNECEAGQWSTSEVKLHSGAYIENHRLVGYHSQGLTRPSS